MEVDIHSKKLKKSVDIEFAYPHFTMSTDENNCLSHTLLITFNNFKRISLNNTHTHRDHDGHGQEGVKMVFSLIKLCLQKNPTSKARRLHELRILRRLEKVR